MASLLAIGRFLDAYICKTIERGKALHCRKNFFEVYHKILFRSINKNIAERMPF